MRFLRCDYVHARVHMPSFFPSFNFTSPFFFLFSSFHHAYRYFVEAGALAVRRVKKEDLTRLARATGGEVHVVGVLVVACVLAALLLWLSHFSMDSSASFYFIHSICFSQ